MAHIEKEPIKLVDSNGEEVVIISDNANIDFCTFAAILASLKKTSR